MFYCGLRWLFDVGSLFVGVSCCLWVYVFCCCDCLMLLVGCLFIGGLIVLFGIDCFFWYLVFVNFVNMMCIV